MTTSEYWTRNLSILSFGSFWYGWYGWYGWNEVLVRLASASAKASTIHFAMYGTDFSVNRSVTVSQLERNVQSPFSETVPQMLILAHFHEQISIKFVLSAITDRLIVCYSMNVCGSPSPHTKRTSALCSREHGNAQFVMGTLLKPNHGRKRMFDSFLEPTVEWLAGCVWVFLSFEKNRTWINYFMFPNFLSSDFVTTKFRVGHFLNHCNWTETNRIS